MHANPGLPPPTTDVPFDPSWIGGAFGIVVALFVFIVVLRQFLYICPPSQILVFSGRKHKLADGSSVGFKVLHGGRGFRMPLLEQVSRMDVRLYGVEVGVTNAFSKGGIPLTVHAIANVKISTDEKHVHQAVERFLNAPPAQIVLVAKQTLEGVLREVLSQLTPEEVNNDRLKFADSLVKNAKDDFDKLGLELDVLKVQHVSDEQKYLQNLGRAQIASMLRDGQNAENQAEQRVREEQAKARQRAESAQQQAESMVLQKRNGFRAEIAKLEAEAQGIENEAQVAAETARATAEQDLQGLRAELSKLALQVETVLPAEAAALASKARAAGDAAPVVENGKATAEAIRMLVDEWTNAGPNARDIYLLQQLDTVVAAAVARVQALSVQDLEIIDGGDAKSLGAVAAGFSSNVARVLEETGRAMGIDVRALIQGTPPTTDDGAPHTLRGGSR
ncbi:MAG TPA: SPFH domain-containing protein [Polyangiaceae bacterium]